MLWHPLYYVCKVSEFKTVLRIHVWVSNNYLAQMVVIKDKCENEKILLNECFVSLSSFGTNKYIVFKPSLSKKMLFI